MWTYKQSTGELSHDDQSIGFGYSGHGEGINNPDLQSESSVGPIPQGWWTIENAIDSVDHGPVAMHLTPKAGTETFGRGPFLIHGDSAEHPGQASLGCIIMAREIRNQVSASPDRDLTVIA